MSMTLLIMLLCEGLPSWTFHFVTFSSSVYFFFIRQKQTEYPYIKQEHALRMLALLFSNG